MAAPEQQVQADGQIQAPASLQPLLTLALAAQGQQDGASAVLLALGYPEGHPHRSQIFAALNGVLAVCAPQVHLAGLSMVRPVPGTAARARLLRFVEEHMSVFQQAVMRQGALPTIVSCVARGLRCDALLRERHGARFLDQVGDMYSQLRPGAASGSSAGGSLPEAGNAGGGEAGGWRLEAGGWRLEAGAFGEPIIVGGLVRMQFRAHASFSYWILVCSICATEC